MMKISKEEILYLIFCEIIWAQIESFFDIFGNTLKHEVLFLKSYTLQRLTNNFVKAFMKRWSFWNSGLGSFFHKNKLMIHFICSRGHFDEAIQYLDQSNCMEFSILWHICSFIMEEFEALDKIFRNKGYHKFQYISRYTTKYLMYTFFLLK